MNQKSLLTFAKQLRKVASVSNYYRDDIGPDFEIDYVLNPFIRPGVNINKIKQELFKMSQAYLKILKESLEDGEAVDYWMKETRSNPNDTVAQQKLERLATIILRFIPQVQKEQETAWENQIVQVQIRTGTTKSRYWQDYSSGQMEGGTDSSFTPKDVIYSFRCRLNKANELIDKHVNETIKELGLENRDMEDVETFKGEMAGQTGGMNYEQEDVDWIVTTLDGVELRSYGDNKWRPVPKYRDRYDEDDY